MSRLKVDQQYVAHVMAMLNLEVNSSVLKELAEALETQLRGLGYPDPSEPVDTDPELTFDPRWRR